MTDAEIICYAASRIARALCYFLVEEDGIENGRLILDEPGIELYSYAAVLKINVKFGQVHMWVSDGKIVSQVMFLKANPSLEEASLIDSAMEGSFAQSFGNKPSDRDQVVIDYLSRSNCVGTQ